MTLDQLDRAFQVGLIHSNTLIREGGTQEWQTLGAVAGLEDEPATQEAATARAEPPSRTSVLPAPPEEDGGRETLAGLGGFLAVAPMGLQGVNAARSQTPPIPPAAVAPLPSRNATRPMGSGVPAGAAPPLPNTAFGAAPAAASFTKPAAPAMASRPPPLPPQAFTPAQPSAPPAAPLQSAPPAMASRPPPLPSGAFAAPPAKPQASAPLAAPPAMRSAPPLQSAPPAQAAPPLRSAPPLQSAPPPPRTSAPPLPTSAFPGTASQPPAAFSAPPAAPVVRAPVSRGADRATNLLIAAMALLTLVIILQRNGALFELMVKLKMEKSYVAMEQSLLGPPSPETPRGVQLIFEPQPVAASTR